MDTLLHKLEQDFPQLRFVLGNTFSWSPKERAVTYKQVASDEIKAVWSLLHEVSHALLEHNTYELDIELVKLEADAWEHARKLANNYGYLINYDHIQDCLDTYRDWLHKRSTCPVCNTHSFQKNKDTYCCINCSATWKVSHAKVCRPYRRLLPSQYK